jgi:uncharacterized membrane protein
MSLATNLNRLSHNRPRLFVSLLGGAIVYALLPSDLTAPIRFVGAWDLGIVAFLTLVLGMVVRATPQTVRFRARREDEKAWVILVLVVGAALASMIAIGIVLHQAKDLKGWLATGAIALAGLTILLSWLMAHTMFALHFAHAYYGDEPGADDGPPDANDKAAGAETRVGDVAGGLEFPGEKEPDYWDFLYFAFVVGMTCQVSDVQVSSRRMRRLTLGHGLIAFLFNTVVLALCINILASLL